jgi:DNA-binding NarL/FixJ family response regulator
MRSTSWLTATIDAVAHFAWARGDAAHALKLVAAAEKVRAARGLRRNPDSTVWLGRWFPAGVAGSDQANGTDTPTVSEVLALANLVTNTTGRDPTRSLPSNSVVSTRELEVAELIARGHSDREIAEQLVLSERTVHTHVRNLLEKLGLRNRAGIAAWFATNSVAARA